MPQPLCIAPVLAARLGDPMHFHSYSLRKEDEALKLELVGQHSTDSAGIAKCLELRSEAKVELEDSLKQLESKITDKTLMSIETPPPASSLAKEATEDES